MLALKKIFMIECSQHQKTNKKSFKRSSDLSEGSENWRLVQAMQGKLNEIRKVFLRGISTLLGIKVQRTQVPEAGWYRAKASLLFQYRKDAFFDVKNHRRFQLWRSKMLIQDCRMIGYIAQNAAILSSKSCRERQILSV